MGKLGKMGNLGKMGKLGQGCASLALPQAYLVEGDGDLALLGVAPPCEVAPPAMDAVGGEPIRVHYPGTRLRVPSKPFS